MFAALAKNEDIAVLVNVADSTVNIEEIKIALRY
jgi:hypothetical protein